MGNFFSSEPTNKANEMQKHMEETSFKLPYDKNTTIEDLLNCNKTPSIRGSQIGGNYHDLSRHGGRHRYLDSNGMDIFDVTQKAIEDAKKERGIQDGGKHTDFSDTDKDGNMYPHVKELVEKSMGQSGGCACNQQTGGGADKKKKKHNKKYYEDTTSDSSSISSSSTSKSLELEEEMGSSSVSSSTSTDTSEQSKGGIIEVGGTSNGMNSDTFEGGRGLSIFPFNSSETVGGKKQKHKKNYRRRG